MKQFAEEISPTLRERVARSPPHKDVFNSSEEKSNINYEFSPNTKELQNQLNRSIPSQFVLPTAAIDVELINVKVKNTFKKKVTFADLRYISEEMQKQIIEEENKKGSRPCPRRTSI